MKKLEPIKEFSKEEILSQLENEEIDVDFLVDYIVKINHVYNELINDYNSLEKYNEKLRDKYVEFKKGLNKVMRRSKIWKERYYRERRKGKEMKKKMDRKNANDILYEVDDFLDNMRDAIANFQYELDEYKVNECIRNIDNFIWKLKCENLYTDELESFINNYLKYNND